MYFNLKGNSIYYSTVGTGPAMVLLHGFLESSTMWHNLIPALSEKHKVIILDFPGHGKSETISEIHSMELMAEIVAELLDHLQIFTATAVGHSMGGYVALALTEKYEEKIDRLFLINSTPKEDSIEKKEVRDRAIDVLLKNPKAFISMAISNLFSEESSILFANEIENLKEEAYTFPIEGIVANIKGMKIRADRTQTLKKYNRPKYIIAGVYDPLLIVSSLESCAEETNTNLIKLDCSHMAVLEKAANIEDIILFNY